ncbi:PREDICTED: uncharacterized protein LOC108756077 [Trachymyrmex septentrionalis]|uniref:uncharacterized protein LOC108756077 n=1 Tax=Trachymyrmex septentrionalis TaxID=34720 RepID=UPI00084EF705|nr:PREDICTED: uncharacterized protein LOC108756077 [Trachymyrmex septentrionalis]
MRAGPTSVHKDTLNVNKPSLTLSPSNLISIHPSSFTSHRSSSLTTVRNGWFLNLSSVSIPIDIQCFLQLGENFALPLNDKHKIIFDCIKSVETGVHRMPIENRIAITNHSIPILNSIISSPITTSPIDKLLLRMESKTRAFLLEHTNVLFTHADKGNVTVALDRDVYMNKMITLLNDKDTYSLINKDPIRKITTAIRSMLTRWKTKKYISEAKYKTLYCSDGSLPRAYGVPKIHKPGCPFRVIVSSLGSPLYPLATFLHNILVKSIPKAESYIKNSFELVEKLKRLHTTDQYKLISLDVKSLFTDVPVDIAIDCVNERWMYVSGDCPLPRDEFVGAIRFILDSTFFLFNNNFYKQSYDTPMGPPLSPVIADLVMRRFETVSSMSLNLDVTFYFRYVDDICTAVEPSKIDSIMEQLLNALIHTQQQLAQGQQMFMQQMAESQKHMVTLLQQVQDNPTSTSSQSIATDSIVSAPLAKASQFSNLAE